MERRGSPEGSGLPFRGGPCRRHGTTTAQKLGENFLAAFIDLLSLTKRQRVCYLSKETLEACQQCEELAREIGMSVVGRGSLCERCMDFRILCIPQTLP